MAVLRASSRAFSRPLSNPAVATGVAEGGKPFSDMPGKVEREITQGLEFLMAQGYAKTSVWGCSTSSTIQPQYGRASVSDCSRFKGQGQG